MQGHRLTRSLKKTARTFANLLPIIIGMLLLTSLAVTIFPEQIAADLFGGNDALDALIGASVGSVAVYKRQDGKKSDWGKKLLEQSLAWSRVVCYGL